MDKVQKPVSSEGVAESSAFREGRNLKETGKPTTLGQETPKSVVTKCDDFVKCPVGVKV
jgi:hypothetical protein